MFKESQKEIHANTNTNNEEYIVVYTLYQNVLLFLFLMHTCTLLHYSK